MEGKRATRAEAKADEEVAAKRSEVIIAVAILVLLVTLVIAASKIWNPKCAKPVSGATAEPAKVLMKDRYRGGVRENVKARGMGSESYDDERLSEFHLGAGRAIEVIDYGRLLESATAFVAGWFRVPPSDSIVHLFEKTGHSEPRAKGLDAELKPGQKIFQMMLLRDRLTLHIFNSAGTVAQSVSVMNENLRDGQWHLIGFSVDPSKGVCVFVDGALVGHQRITSGLATNVHPVVFSSGQPSDAKFFASNITYSLQATDKIRASALYNNGIPQDPRLLIPKLHMWLPLQNNMVWDSMQNMKASIVTGAKRVENFDAVHEKGKATIPNSFVY